MTDIDQYIDDGIVERYCLQIASSREVVQLQEMMQHSPALREYVATTEKALNIYLKTVAKTPPADSLTKIQNAIRANLAIEGLTKIAPKNRKIWPEFIEINKFTPLVNLKNLISHLQPPAEFDNLHLEPLFIGQDHSIHVVWAKQLVPEEVHPAVDEYFYLLQGTVTCVIDRFENEMKPGDFMRIPPTSAHLVHVTSKQPAVAIASRKPL